MNMSANFKSFSRFIFFFLLKFKFHTYICMCSCENVKMHTLLQGTGKTSTLIEMILQLHRKGNSRLIVAAPSNSAANLLTQRLANSGALKAGQFVRIVSQNSIERDQIPDELRIHCITVDIAAPRSRAEPVNPVENGIRVQCNSEQIGMHRILVSTCSTFGSLLYMKFRTGHFTHVIVDEAGQCTEPEIAIPISLIDKNDGQIILAGDPHQLGPVVLSPVAKKCGLSKSLLSRLLDHLPYRPDVGVCILMDIFLHFSIFFKQLR